MGIKDIATENKCLLLKLLHRLHNPGDCVGSVGAGARQLGNNGW